MMTTKKDLILSKEIFQNGIKMLEVAFGEKLKSDRMKLYREFTQHISDDVFLWIVKEIIKEENKFPSIARLQSFKDWRT